MASTAGTGRKLGKVAGSKSIAGGFSSSTAAPSPASGASSAAAGGSPAPFLAGGGAYSNGSGANACTAASCPARHKPREEASAEAARVVSERRPCRRSASAGDTTPRVSLELEHPMAAGREADASTWLANGSSSRQRLFWFHGNMKWVGSYRRKEVMNW
nr:unnamed protein product [Digitaria exilis]